LDDDEIASAVNDVFCGLAKYVSRGKFTRDGSLKTLLLTMARRKGYDQLRRKTKGHSRYPVCAAVDWVVEKFLYFNKEELELLATVDFAALELLQQRKAITMDNVRSVIATAKKWAAKLEREIFSDENISQALSELRDLFPKTYA
jgi:DNA-directed RNA polymerase specialized sigma24 family protein